MAHVRRLFFFAEMRKPKERRPFSYFGAGRFGDGCQAS